MYEALRVVSSFQFSDHQPDHQFGWEKRSSKKHVTSLATKLVRLQEVHAAASAHALLVVVQGTDASGKDGVIRNVFAPLGPKGLRVTSWKAPTEEERSHDFLWRLHRQTPALGEIGIWNRSQLEDVVTAGLLGIIDDEEASRRCQAINAFESLLVDAQCTVLKIFLHVSPEMQESRLQERVKLPEKRWKFNPNDLEVRAKWHELHSRYTEALRATSTEQAPWYVVPADRKWVRDRIVMDLVIDALEKHHDEYPQADLDWEHIKIPTINGPEN